MTRPIFHVQRCNTHALPVTHHKIEREPLDEELHTGFQTLPIKCMQHRMPRAITCTSSAICLPTLAILQALPTQRSLIYRPLISSRKRHAVVLQLNNRRNRFLSHVVNCVLVAEPVGALDGVVHVPAPVVFCHVAKRSIDAALSRDGVRAGWKELRYACCLETGFCEPNGCA